MPEFLWERKALTSRALPTKRDNPDVGTDLSSAQEEDSRGSPGAGAGAVQGRCPVTVGCASGLAAQAAPAGAELVGAAIR